MGCTSSAPSKAECPINTADDLENNTHSRSEESEKRKNENDETGNSNGHNEIDIRQVLPVGESLSNQTLARNKNSPVLDNSKSDLDIKKEDQDSTRKTENSTTVKVESSQVDDKYLSLKHVVEKAIIDATEEEQKINEQEQNNLNIDRYNEEVNSKNNVAQESEPSDTNNEDAKESGSPTQSEESRATRWEALADIAAELPPSLAVDPITGQIYSLTK